MFKAYVMIETVSTTNKQTFTIIGIIKCCSVFQELKEKDKPVLALIVWMWSAIRYFVALNSLELVKKNTNKLYSVL